MKTTPGVFGGGAAIGAATVPARRDQETATQRGRAYPVGPAMGYALMNTFAVKMAAVGYQAGLSETRRSPAMLGMVLFLIADLDRAHEGLLTISQQPMIDLQKSMQAEKTH